MTDGNAQALISLLASKQIDIYRQQPEELRSHYEAEQSALAAYRGRQLLELLQNADDAGESATRECKLRIDVSRNRLVVANTGVPFSEAGVKSLVISNFSPKVLDRNRFIGCKGLGFRAVLTWSSRPVVSSGPYVLGFDRDIARNAVRRLSAHDEALRVIVDDYEHATGECPAPIMRFPFVPADGEHVETAMRLRPDFDTVIALPLLEGEWGDAVHQEILRQLEALSARALLFCRHITSLEIVGDIKRDWKLIRETRGPLLQDIVISCDGVESFWTVHRPEPGKLEPSPDRRASTREEYELAVAVPQHASQNPDATLCVFFPTMEKVPCSLALHATLDTTDDRNHLHDTTTNRAVLKHLAASAAVVLSDEARNADRKAKHRALALLAGIEVNDGPLGFSRELLEACATLEIFPRVDGRVASIANVRRPPHEVWSLSALAPAFPEMLDVTLLDDATRSLVQRFVMNWYGPTTLKARLQAFVRSTEPKIAGEVLGQLYAAKQLPGFSPNDFVIDAEGKLLSGSGAAFFAPSGKLPGLPAWAIGVRFLHPEFAAGFQRGTRLSNLGMLAGHIRQWGGRVDEYRFDTIAGVLVEEANAAADPARWRDVLAWLYSAWKASPQRIDTLDVRLATTRKTLAPARQCYFGPAYSRGAFTSRLYGQFATSDLIEAPALLGLPTDGESSTSVADFLEALGVAPTPRTVTVPWTDTSKLIQDIASTLTYPCSIDNTLFTSSRELVAAGRCSIENLRAPDRIRDLIRGKDTGALVAYLLSSAGAATLAAERDESAMFCVTVGRKINPRPAPHVVVPNPTLHWLREEPWVPTIDGGRKRPREIVLGRQVAGILRDFYFAHAIDVHDPEIASHGGARGVESLLVKLGAITSLESLDAERLYEVLLSLPDRDPKGTSARRLYVALLDARIETGDAEAKRRFFREGKVWGTHGGREGYFPIQRLRYNANLTLPSVARPYFHLAALPEGRNIGHVKRLLDVAVLQRSDVPLTLDEEVTAFENDSEEFNQHLQRALAFLYALRVAATTEHAREARQLFRARLRVCQSIRVRLGVPGGSAAVIDLSPGERIVVEDELLIVATDPPMGWIEFWSAVATLVSELMGSAYSAAEVGNVIRCRTTSEMEEVVRGLLGAKAEDALTVARAASPAAAPSEAPREFALPPPRHTAEAGVATDDDSDKVPSEGVEGIKPSAPPVRDDAPAATPPNDFAPIEGPTRGPKTKRTLVVAGKARPSAARGPLATEDVTFAVADAYEFAEGRFPIDVDHVRGREAFGCDRISVRSEEIKQQALAAQRISEEDIERFIEVKGSSSRTRALELTENESERAKGFHRRYFIYRVYVNRRTGGYELATLQDPANSRAVTQVTRFDLAEGSGAEWFECSYLEESEGSGGADEREVLKVDVPRSPATLALLLEGVDEDT